MAHDHDDGLARDLHTLSRRELLGWLAGAAAALPLAGCAGQDGMGEDLTDASDGVCPPIPEETAGPYPGDGSNGPNALTLADIVRSDITTSVGSASGTATGVPLTVTLRLVSNGGGCAAVAGLAVYLWHADKDGNYSMYSTATKNQNYLRGVQVSDADGVVTFETIFPGCYDGRMPHIHFEVYPSLDAATDADNKIHTSQLAFPEAPCDAVYASDGYEQSVSNFAKISFDSDNVFSDGVELQLSTVSGSVAAGYVAELDVAVSA